MASARSAQRASCARTAAKLAGAIRYCFDRSVTTGAYYRIVLDLDGNKYWAERSDERMYLARDKENSPGQGQGVRRGASESASATRTTKRDDADRRSAGSAAQLEPPPAPKRARFQTFKDATLPQVKLARLHVRDVYTPPPARALHQGARLPLLLPRRPHRARRRCGLDDGDDFYFTLVVHPLTGRVEVHARQGRHPDATSATRDEEGQTEVPR